MMSKEREFFCPICESKLEIENQSKIWKEPRFLCFCKNCGVYKVGINEVTAYLEFVKEVPVQFHLEKLSDKLDEIGAGLSRIAYDIRTSRKGARR